MNSDDLWRDLQQIRLENAMHFNEIQKMFLTLLQAINAIHPETTKKSGREILDVSPTGLTTVVNHDTNKYEFYGDKLSIEQLKKILKEQYNIDPSKINNEKENNNEQ